MTVETVLINVLQQAGLTVYPLSVPADGIYPCVVYQRISTPQIRSHAGVELEYPRMQLSCWGKRFSDVVSTAETVKQVLDLNRVNFKLATKESELDVKDVEPGLYRRILDFFIWT